MENNTFSYNYSATRNKEVESIRNKYMPHEESKLEKLKKLDLRVQTAGMIEGLSIGIIGALVFGIGMCFFLDVFVGAAWLSALFMIIGTLIMSLLIRFTGKSLRKPRRSLHPKFFAYRKK